MTTKWIIWAIIVPILACCAYNRSQHLTKSQKATEHTCQIFRSEINNYVELTFNGQNCNKRFHNLEKFVDKNEIPCWTNLSCDIQLQPYSYEVDDVLNIVLIILLSFMSTIICIFFMIAYVD
jgi:hypothetical protein